MRRWRPYLFAFLLVTLVICMILLSVEWNDTDEPSTKRTTPEVTSEEDDGAGLGVRIPGMPIDIGGNFCIPISDFLCIVP